jgi:CRP-like cAMP-binding protein
VIEAHFQKMGFFTVAILNDGQTFGELALLNKKPRMATVVCTQKTHCMVLTKQAYGHIIGKMENRILNQKVEFLTEVPHFKLLSKNSLSKIIYSLQKVFVTKGTYLFKEGEETRSLFIIISGEFEVTKMVENNHETKKNLAQLLKDPLKAKRIAIANNSKSLKHLVNKKNLFILGRGQVVGEDDIILKHPTYRTTVKCISNYGEVFEIAQEDFLKFKQIGQ